MFGNAEQPFLIEDAKLGEHAVNRATQCRCAVLASKRAGDPVLKKRSRHAVARSEGRHAIAHRDHFAATIGSDDGGLRCVAGIAAGDHREIAKVERNGFDGDQDLAGARLGNRDFVENQLASMEAPPVVRTAWALRAVFGAARCGALITK